MSASQLLGGVGGDLPPDAAGQCGGLAHRIVAKDQHPREFVGKLAEGEELG